MMVRRPERFPDTQYVMNDRGPKLLVVTGSHLTPALADYALNMAVRLDLEILVLFVRDSQQEQGHNSAAAVAESFAAQVEGEASGFAALAWKSSVMVTTIVDTGDREAAINRVLEQDSEIRFILAEDRDPGEDHEKISGAGNGGRPRLTVIRNG